MTGNRGNRHWGPTDAGMARLVCLVLDEAWTPESAARGLLSVVHDPDVLHAMDAEVRRADHEQPSSLTSRAAQTLRQAIGTVAPVVSV